MRARRRQLYLKDERINDDTVYDGGNDIGPKFLKFGPREDDELEDDELEDDEPKEDAQIAITVLLPVELDREDEKATTTIWDMALTDKDKVQVIAIAFVALMLLVFLITVTVFSHGLIIPLFLMLFKAGGAATSAFATSAVANAATIGGVSGGIATFGFFVPTALKKCWARNNFEKQASAFK